MTLKLTIQQAEALYNVFVSVIIPEPCTEVSDKLVMTLMKQIFNKLRAKLEGKLKGDGYSISLTDTEAMAYYVYFNERQLGNHWLYEQTFIDTQVNNLNKLYA